jgi:ppGpp synthetase/RelA/SpoT-type nucleotidyltranferase
MNPLLLAPAMDLAIARALERWLYGGDDDGAFLAMPTSAKPKVKTEAPPWISKERLNRAGAALRAPGKLTSDDMEVLDSWRAAHSYVINTFQSILRLKTRNTDAIVGQRLKRRKTIVDKLYREPGVQLSRMDDIAGCRLIFPSIPDINSFRAAFHKSKFKHKRRNDGEKSKRYNYIQSPKPTGYRGIHDIYEYNVRSKTGKRYNGLLLELQYRTNTQHAWATTVEVVGLITENQPKFNRGDDQYLEFFKLASEIIARAHESCKSTYADLSDQEVVRRFQALTSSECCMVYLWQIKAYRKLEI